MTVYAGIDNGLDGGVVAVDFSDHHSIFRVIEVSPSEWIKKGKKNSRRLIVPAMVKIIARLKELDALVVLEEAQSMPDQGVKSMFTTGLGRGLWEGMLAMAGVRYETVHPRTWQTTLFKGTPGGDPKSRATEYAQRMFPMANFILPRCRKPHDGLCDAACMVLYARMKFGA